MTDKISVLLETLKGLKELEKEMKKTIVSIKCGCEENCVNLYEKLLSLVKNIFTLNYYFLELINAIGAEVGFKYTFSLNNKLKLSLRVGQSDCGEHFLKVEINYKYRMMNKPIMHYSLYLDKKTPSSYKYKSIINSERIIYYIMNFKDKEFTVTVEDGKIIALYVDNLMCSCYCRNSLRKFLLDLKNVDIKACFYNDLQNLVSRTRREQLTVMFRT